MKKILLIPTTISLVCSIAPVASLQYHLDVNQSSTTKTDALISYDNINSITPDQIASLPIFDGRKVIMANH